MRYSYDPQKRLSNLKKHGIDFQDAYKVIENELTVTFEDRRFSYNEERFVTLGKLNEIVVVIITAETDSEIRIISMRKANKHEEKIYYQNSTGRFTH